MSIEQLKHEILELVEQTNDEEILIMVKEELAGFGTGKQDAVDLLPAEEQEELERMVNEDPLNETISLNELKASIDQWRSK